MLHEKENGRLYVGTEFKFDTIENINQQREQEGVTGELTPNIQRIMDMRKISREFDHTHGTATEVDCFIYVARFGIGNKGDKAAVGIGAGCIGCTIDIVDALTEFLSSDPTMIHVFEVAVRKAKEHYIRQTMGIGLDDIQKIINDIRKRPGQ